MNRVEIFDRLVRQGKPIWFDGPEKSIICAYRFNYGPMYQIVGELHATRLRLTVKQFVGLIYEYIH